MKRIIPILAALTLTLAGCTAGNDNGDTPTSTTPATSSATSSTTSTESTPSTRPSAESAATTEPAAEQSAAMPTIDQLTPVNTAMGAGTLGSYLDPATGKYYFCNPGNSEGMPAAPGTCAGPMTWDQAEEAVQQAGQAFEAHMSNEFPDANLNQPPADECIGYGCSPEQDAAIAEAEGDATTKFWECMEAGGTEETCLQ